LHSYCCSLWDIENLDKTRLKEFGGYIDLNRHWAQSLFKHMRFVQRRETTSKSKQSVEDFTSTKENFLDDLVATVEMEEIPRQLIFNWGQTGIKLVPSTSWTMAEKGLKRVELIGLSDKGKL